MPKKVIRYICEHCNKYTKASKKTVQNHEAICFMNPATKSCAACNNFELPVLVSVNGVLKINEAHYKQMLAPQYKDHLQTHEYPDYHVFDMDYENQTSVNITETYYHNYCHAKGCIDKLTTNCDSWEAKEVPEKSSSTPEVWSTHRATHTH